MFQYCELSWSYLENVCKIRAAVRWHRCYHYRASKYPIWDWSSYSRESIFYIKANSKYESLKCYIEPLRTTAFLVPSNNVWCLTFFLWKLISYVQWENVFFTLSSRIATHELVLMFRELEKRGFPGLTYTKWMMIGQYNWSYRDSYLKVYSSNVKYK